MAGNIMDNCSGWIANAALEQGLDILQRATGLFRKASIPLSRVIF